MALKEKYSELIRAAHAGGMSSLEVKEQNGILHITGEAPSETVKRKLIELYEQLNSNYQSGDIIMNIHVDGASL